MNKKFLDIGGEPTCYIDEGSGPPLVLIHGFLVSHAVWADVLPALTARHRVVALDLPGHGDSARPDPAVCPYDATYLSEKVSQFLKALGIDRAAVLGHSMGGQVASHLASRHPEQVSRLILVNAQGLPQPLPLLGRLVLLPVLGKILFMKGYTRAVVKAYFRGDVFANPDNVKESMVDEVYRCLNLPGGREALYAILRNTIVPDAGFAGVLQGIKVPAKVIWGEHDRIFPLALGHGFLKALPGAELVVIAGVGHTPVEEAPARTAEEILAFLAAGVPVAAAS